MSNITLVTTRDLQGENPLMPSSKYFNDFVLLNMGPGTGIWLVDKLYKKYADIRDAAILVAKTYGDEETFNKLTTEKES